MIYYLSTITLDAVFSMVADNNYNLPPGFLSLRKDEPLPELFPQTPVSSYQVFLAKQPLLLLSNYHVLTTGTVYNLTLPIVII